MFRLKFWTAALVAAVATLSVPAVSQAAFTFKLTLSDGVNGDLVITDGDVGVDLDTDAKAIFYKGIYNGYDVKILANTNSPGGGTILGPNGAELFMNSFTVEKVGNVAAPLTITVFANEYAPFADTVTNATVINSLSGSGISVGSTVTSSTTVSPGTGDVTTPEAKITPLAGADTTYSYPASLGNPFSVTQTATITFDTSSALQSKVNFDATSTIIAPAPPGLIMAVTALPFFGVIRRRLRKTGVPTA